MKDSFANQGASLTIGQMARVSSVTERALRIYHKKGILVPALIDESTGYRYYSLSQCATLDLIQQMKLLGFSLDEIKYIIEKNSVEYLAQRVKDSVSHVQSEISRLKETKLMGEAILRNCDEFSRRLPLDTVRYEKLPERRILRLCPMSSPIETRMDDATVYWEETLHEAKKAIVDKGYPIALFRNVSNSVSMESLVEGKPQYRDAIVFVSKGYGKLYGKAEIVPEGVFATIYSNHYVDEDGNYTEKDYIDTLVSDIQAKGYRIAGDYIGEVIAETPIFSDERMGMLARLQIPVSLPPEL